ncbi:hypothetical protein C2G38_2080556 [Gigaspora rosea]|uniref:Uncharacterized protein n=1 Tax=Gigaspora rosea TaxID=44941 RepID=A0A397VKY6_9GLOM|nr:hypothetical protein C2G38_2080556 [Gigaspora rosea]
MLFFICRANFSPSAGGSDLSLVFFIPLFGSAMVYEASLCIRYSTLSTATTNSEKPTPTLTEFVRKYNTEQLIQFLPTFILKYCALKKSLVVFFLIKPIKIL